jgi:hypothetical protein
MDKSFAHLRNRSFMAITPFFERKAPVQERTVRLECTVESILLFDGRANARYVY